MTIAKYVVYRILLFAVCFALCALLPVDISWKLVISLLGSSLVGYWVLRDQRNALAWWLATRKTPE